MGKPKVGEPDQENHIDGNHMEDSADQTQITLTQLLKYGVPAIAAVLVAASGATFAITKYSSQQSIDAAETRREYAEQLARDAKEDVRKLQTSAATSSRMKGTSVLPQVTLDATKDSQSTQEIADKISQLENEKEQLIQQLSQGN